MMFLKYRCMTSNDGLSCGLRPLQATPDAACIDIFMPYNVYIDPLKHVTVNLLLAFDIPKGWCLYLQPRSSTFTKRHILSTTGIIDCDYKGPVHAQLFNMSDIPVEIKAGERLVQAQLFQTQQIQLEAVERILPDLHRIPEIGSTGT